MRQRFLLGAGMVIAVLAGIYLLRGTASRKAGEAVDDGLAQLIAMLPPGYAASHGATDFNPLTGTLTVHDLAVIHTGAKLLTAETLVVTDLRPQALRDVFDPAAYADGHPAWTDMRLLIGHADITGLAEAPPGADQPILHIGHASLDGLRGRPFALPPTAENRPTRPFRIDAATALAVAGLDVENVDVTLPAQPGVASSGGHIVLAGMTVKNYAAGKLDQAALRGAAMDGQTYDKMSGTTKPVHVGLGLLSIGAVDGAAALAGLDPDDTASQNLDYVKIGSVNLDAADIRIGAAQILAIASASGGTDYTGTGDAASRGTLNSMRLALADLPMSSAQKHTLDIFGMSTFQLDIDGSSHWQAQPRRAVIDRESLTFRDLGTLHIAGSLADLPSGTSTASPGAWLGLKIESLSLAWDDASLANRLIAVAADGSHTTPDAMRQQLAMPLAMLSPMIPDEPDAADQVNAFLEHPHHLAVTLAPPHPVTIGQVLAAPMPERAHLLGLHVHGD